MHNTIIILTCYAVQDIKEFSESHKGSKAEADELKTAYLEHEGDMDRIMQDVRRSLAVLCC